MPNPPLPYEIHLHHVGGYGGGCPLQIPAPFRRDVCLYLYDANAPTMEGATSTEFRRQLNLGQALFDRDGDTDVHITYHPAASSLFPLSPEFGAYWKDAYNETDMCDVLTSEMREVRTVRVACTTLDNVCQEHGAGLDFLSLDAEGSEKQILHGARTALATSVVALISEIHFMDLRVGQTTAGELLEQVNRSGFHLADMQLHPGRSYMRLPIGWRSDGAVGSGDATFFKRFDVIKANYPAPAIALAKLGFFCLLTKKLEHAIAAAQAAEDTDRDVFTAGSGFAYLRLLSELLDLSRKEQPLCLPTWTDFYPTADAGLRHGDANRGVDVRDACRRYFSRVNPMAFIQRVCELANQQDTPVEALLRRYEFEHLTAMIKDRRQRSLGSLLTWLGLFEKDEPTSPQTIAHRISERLAS